MCAEVHKRRARDLNPCVVFKSLPRHCHDNYDVLWDDCIRSHFNPEISKTLFRFE